MVNFIATKRATACHLANMTASQRNSYTNNVNVGAALSHSSHEVAKQRVNPIELESNQNTNASLEFQPLLRAVAILET